MPTQTSTPTLRTAVTAIRARRALGHARRQGPRFEVSTNNVPTVERELQAIVNHYPSEMPNDSIER
jgi:hypothetical protein